MTCLCFSRRLPLWSLFCLLLTVSGWAETTRRPLSPADFDGWREFHTPQLSRDGRWLAYSDMPQVEDGHVVARNLATGQEWREPAGARPPPPFPPPVSPNPEDTPPPRQVRINLTSDSTFLVAGLFPTKAEQVEARIKKAKPEDQPKSPLLFLNLATGESRRVLAVKNFQVPARGGAWVAYLKEAAPPPPPAPPVPEKRRWFRKPAPAPAPTPKPEVRRQALGTDLVLHDLATDREWVFPEVVEYSFARDGRTLLLAVSAKDEQLNGVYAVTPGADTAPRALVRGPGTYSKLTWDREQTQAAFFAAPIKGPLHAMHWPRDAAQATELKFSPPAPLQLSDKAAPAFSRDGRKLYFGTAPPRPKPAKPAAIDPEDVVSADLWSWHDDFVQPAQQVQAARERNRTYRGVFDLAGGRFTQLADETLPEISLSDDGTRALGYDNRPYRRLADFDGLYADIYLVDAATGERRLIIEKMRHGIGNRRGGPGFGWSPDGRWAAYYDAGHWHLLDTATGESRNLTAALPVSFAQEMHDTPEPPPAHGWAGWGSDSSAVLLYDRYDVWGVPVDGSAAVNITQGDGRKRRIIYRIQNTEPREVDAEDRGIDLDQPVVLRGESETTRATGFFSSFSLGGGPAKLLWDDKAFTYAGRALEADVLLVTASRFDEFPDIHVTNAKFDGLKKVTDGGAQLAPFRWGTAELMDFTNADGVPLQAAVYKPADFDPKKKYPVIVYIYERLSQIVHRFTPPAPQQNINFPLYASNGYIILTPDIVYTEGEPGPSALKCVLPAVDALVAQGFVDENAIGIQGHSWGGYQIAYMLTQTNRFRAAEAGAPVGNMTSAYGGIRWGPGIPRLFQYEQTQSRIGAPLTAATERYLANSPVFQAHKVETPLLILHNDHDDAVPWQQGIELFLALRRHDKPVWFFNYHRELHGLRRRADLKDFSQRMWQFFDHFLRGAPAPDWLEKGIPYLEREEEKLRFNSLPAQDARSSPPIHE
ncbi:MAG: S9 family peptidase [Opitutaceae bacterium]|nr:S9 family peptidase [Opitutaceae bacterium]